MNRILELSPEDQIAVVEPGVITAELDRAAGEHGLRYAPDPASAAISTIGGNIATNAGGLRCAKYGVTRDAVLGLEAVLADGTVVRTGRRTVKGVTGYDLTALLTGSEGTLGGDHRRDGTAAAGAGGDGHGRRVLRHLRPGAEAVVRDHRRRCRAGAGGAARRPGAGAVDDVRAGCGTRGAACCCCSATGGARQPRRRRPYGCSRQRAASVESDRRPGRGGAGCSPRAGSALPALERLGRVLIEDIAVPRSRLADAVREIAAIADAPRRADLHLRPRGRRQPPPDRRPRPGPARVPDAAWRGGGRHLQRRPAAGRHAHRRARGGGAEAALAGARSWAGQPHGLQRRIKAVFDPHGILNPGKAL